MFVFWSYCNQRQLVLNLVSDFWAGISTHAGRLGGQQTTDSGQVPSTDQRPITGKSLEKQPNGAKLSLTQQGTGEASAFGLGTDIVPTSNIGQASLHLVVWASTGKFLLEMTNALLEMTNACRCSHPREGSFVSHFHLQRIRRR